MGIWIHIFPIFVFPDSPGIRDFIQISRKMNEVLEPIINSPIPKTDLLSSPAMAAEVRKQAQIQST